MKRRRVATTSVTAYGLNIGLKNYCSICNLTTYGNTMQYLHSGSWPFWSGKDTYTVSPPNPMCGSWSTDGATWFSGEGSGC